MREVLDALVRVPGVRLAALITEDGVPIVASSSGSACDVPLDRDQGLSSLVATAAAWLQDLERAAAPLTWRALDGAFLRGSLGGVVLRRCTDASLLVVLDRGVHADQLRVSVDGALVRMERVMRDLSSLDAPTSTTAQPLSESDATQSATHRVAPTALGVRTEPQTTRPNGDH